LSSERIAAAKQQIENEQKAKSVKADAPLTRVWKVLTFIFPGVIQILFSGTFKADGYDRKAKELLTWTLYGFGFYIALVILISLIDR